MKKLKYLLGLGIVGLGLLCNQSFGITIEGVTIPLGIEMSYVDFQESSNYLYSFGYRQETQNGTATPYERYFGYSLYYNGLTQIDLWPYYANGSCPTRYTTTFNNSAFGPVYYAGRCSMLGRYGQNGFATNMEGMAWGTTFDSTQKVILGNASNFGNGFVYVGEGTSPDPSPKFGFGGGYLTNNNYTALYGNDQLQDYPLRLFYYRNSDSTSPLDGFNIATNTGSNISNFFARQYFTPQGTVFNVANRNLPATFGDLGGSYSKGTHVSGYGFGYSFFVRKSLSKTMTWEDFDFASVGSKCLQTLYMEGTSDPNSQTKQGCQQLGFFVLKGTTYVSYGNTDPVIVVTKDLQNHTRLLYETFNCYEDDIQRIFNSQYCTPIGHGYLSVNGSGDILPFTESGSTYTLTYEGNGILDYFLYQNNDYLSITRTQNGFTLGSYNFEFNPTPDSISIKDYYEEGALGYTGTANSSGTPNEGSETHSTSSLYYRCLGPTYETPDNRPPAFCYDENGVLNPSRFKNCYDTIEDTDDGGFIGHTFCNIDGFYQEVLLRESGSGYSIVIGESTSNILDVLNNPGFNEQYFNNYLNTKGYFFKCPFAYDSNLTLRPKLVSMLQVDPNLPINCVMAGYSQGKNFISNQFNLHILDNGPLLNGDSDKRKMFYRFIDFILLFGILFMFIKIFKLFK